MDYLVDDLDQFVQDETKCAGSIETKSLALILEEKIQRKIQELGNTRLPKAVSNVRNVVQKRNELMRAFFTGNIAQIKKCVHCDSKKIGVSLQDNLVLVSSKVIDQDSEILSRKVSDKTTIKANEVQKMFRLLWSYESETLKKIYPFLKDPSYKIKSRLTEKEIEETPCPTDKFFWETINVPPSRFAPLRAVGGQVYEHEQRTALGRVLMASQALAYLLKKIKTKDENRSKEEESKLALTINQHWLNLQSLCNGLYDEEMVRARTKGDAPGVRQIIEKKEGLFRKNMMGKRVNYAARSVISPDPYINANEIGVPVIFAKKLSFPQPVTPWNLKDMQAAVLNGPEVHPGALSICLNEGFNTRIRSNDEQQRRQQSEALARAVLQKGQVPIVNRHLVTGDIMLLNRQPTLHKPSIMAHVARVLPREKTLRFHYSNCKCYNADFDGDEMNAHFPQSQLSRAEAYGIASVDNQYLVPKDGTPLGGLIQDHIVSATLLSMRGTFFDKGDFMELIYGAISFLECKVKIPKPAIIKPKELWTGKQIISAVIYNTIPKDKPLPNVEYPSKVKPNIFVNRKPSDLKFAPHKKSNEMCESEVVISSGELLQGIIDKASIGASHYGLVHICYELYGGAVSGNLLTSFSRLATNYLQYHIALTLGIHDILVVDAANKKRRKMMVKSEKVGDGAVIDALSIEAEDSTYENLEKQMRKAHVDKDPFYMKMLDNCYKKKCDDINTNISQTCIGEGLVKRFPDNNLQMMIETGAKGGKVNSIQISSLLGQIELEGRRVPLMLSGKSLPSFVSYDRTPRSGGFITGRFLTGIRPQEFFFHCMAGREGLIDTAVKTSRSGYLQRCLVKHLEALVVDYDMTVRDSDGSVVQFQYGEDGLDIVKRQLLREAAFPAVIKNRKTIVPQDEVILKQLETDIEDETVKKHRKSIKKWDKFDSSNVRSKKFKGSAITFFMRDMWDDSRVEAFKNSGNRTSEEIKMFRAELNKEIVAKWFTITPQERFELKAKYLHCPDPLATIFRSDLKFGIISEQLDSVLDKYIKSNPHKLISNVTGQTNFWSVGANEFKRLIYYRYLRSLVEPGEAVGLLAAQSVGEPSTQMTLNTFHFAGRGEMNVTLGIPRLREILMTASENIATPSMDIPFKTEVLRMDRSDAEVEAEATRLRMNSVKMSDILESFEIKEVLVVNKSCSVRKYIIRFKFLRHKWYKLKYTVNPQKVLQYFETKFIKSLLVDIQKKLKQLSQTNSLFDHSTKASRARKIDNADDDDIGDFIDPEKQRAEDKEATDDAKRAVRGDEEDDGSSDEDDGADGGDTLSTKVKKRHDQEAEYEEKDDIEREGEVRDAIFDVTQEDNGNVPGAPVDELTAQPAENEAGLNIESVVHMSKFKVSEIERQERIRAVRSIDPTITDYTFNIDGRPQTECTLHLEYPLSSSKLDMSALIEEKVKTSFIHRIGKIDRAFLVTDDSAKQSGLFDKMIRTEGVSFLELIRFEKLDWNRVYSNDIHAIARTYGIEAGAMAIRREIKNVFAVYGIEVDPRHLSLIADYMTFSGQIKGMNRMGMSSCASPIQQMTFETTCNVLKEATLIGKYLYKLNLFKQLTHESISQVTKTILIRLQEEFLLVSQLLEEPGNSLSSKLRHR